MFCSKCGKTIRPEDSICPSCAAKIGENRFGGIPYTSVQEIFKPGQQEAEPLNNYTRTTYTSMEDADQSNSNADSRTTYRPIYEGASAPMDVRKDMRAAVAESNAEPVEEEEIIEEEQPAAAEMPEFLSPIAQESLDRLDEDLRPDEAIDRSQFEIRPIQSTGRAGISRDVSEYIAKLEDSQQRRGRHRRNAEPVYEEYPEEPVYGSEEYAEQGSEEYYEDQDGVFDEIDDAEFEDMRRGGINPLKIIKILVALIVVAALFVGGVIWIRYISGNQSSAPIEGVSETLYEDGIALIKSRTESSYINERINTYRTSGAASMVLQLNNDNLAIEALVSAEPAPNDATFVDALQAIQNNISNAITMDALAASNADADAVAKSEANWALVSDSIKQLESVSTAAELTAIINGTKISVVTETPAPTPTPIVYKSLVKGDKNNDVLNLQVRLYELGYLNDDRDGNFGSKTQTAVKTFQERAGLSVTGIADSSTQALLFSDDAPYAPGVTTPTPKPTATPEPEQVIQPAEVSGQTV